MILRRPSTTVLMPSQKPSPSMFHGINILPHIPYITSCQIPVGFILLIFDLPIGTSRLKTKTKMAFLKWFLDFKNGPPFLSFGGFQKRGAIFFLVFGFWDEEPAKKTKTPFLFLFLTSLLAREMGYKNKDRRSVFFRVFGSYWYEELKNKNAIFDF